MPPRAQLPPAVGALVDAGVALAGRAPSARIAVARAGAILEPEAIPSRLRAGAMREAEAARAAACVPLAPVDVEAVLRGAWRRRPSSVLDDLDPEPLAVTPAAQVHRGTLDGAAVAVKVRRPGVERLVRADVALLDALAAPLRAAFPGLDAAAVLRDLREQALDELDLELEASTLRRAARALRGIEGVVAPRPHLDLSAPDVMVAELLGGATLAAGARPGDGRDAARALVAAVRAVVFDAGLAPYDLRASHVLVLDDGLLGLLGLGIARRVDRDRAALGLDALAALAGDDLGAFARCVDALGVLGADDARPAHAVLRAVLGGLLDRPARLDAEALCALLERADARAAELLRLAGAVTPRVEDLVLARMVGQLAAVLARLGVAEDWVVLALGR